MRVLLCSLILAVIAGAASAGPWPRDKGSTFLSFSATVDTPVSAPGTDLDGYAALYAEHGLGRGLTFGLDGGMAPTGDYSLVFFLRRPVMEGEGPHRFALRAGGGLHFGGGSTDYLVNIGAAWGRGFESRFGHGWVTLDAEATYRVQARDVAAKADLTLGVKPWEGTKLMLQLQSGDYPGSDPYLRLAPSVAQRISPRMHVELGAQIGVAGDDRMGLKLGTWLEF